MKSTPHLLIEIVSNYFKVPVSDVLSPCRKGEYIRARQISMYFIREKFKVSLAETGSYFNGKDNRNKDHSTIIYACRSVNNQIETNPKYKKDIELLSLLLEDCIILNDEPLKTDENLRYQNQRVKDQNVNLRTSLSLLLGENKILKAEILSLRSKLAAKEAVKPVKIIESTPEPAKPVKPIEKAESKYSHVPARSHEYKPYLSHIF
jgi:regulator of replication initiation timing